MTNKYARRNASSDDVYSSTNSGPDAASSAADTRTYSAKSDPASFTGTTKTHSPFPASVAYEPNCSDT